MKKFLISIDTEGDNLWQWSLGKKITTENAKFLPRFQELCEKYGFKPTYLTNYEMACDEFFVNYFKEKFQSNLCEIGIHLHAWNSPPDYELSVRNDIPPGAAYLIEYPLDLMREKVNAQTGLLKNVFEKDIITHRSGRWATNQDYFNILNEYGYKIDCSVTPMLDWSKAPGQSEGSWGTDYTAFSMKPYIIPQTNLLEIPVTVREDHRIRSLKGCGIKKSITRLLGAKKGYGPIWLRPRSNKENLANMLYLTDMITKEKNTDYLMFMLHSSEFMPGGSLSFPSVEAIEKLYDDLEILFNHISQKYKGYTFKEYYEERK